MVIRFVKPPVDEPRWARRLYGAVAPIYDLLRPTWIARGSDSDLADLLEQAACPGCRVLELASGTGHNLERIREAQPSFGSYLGVDVSSAMLRRARRRGQGDTRIEWLEADARRPDALHWPGNPSRFAPPFDLILSTWFLAHLDRPETTVEAALRLLAPGGTAIFLFFVRPRTTLRRVVVGLFVRGFRGRFVDPDALGHPGLRRAERFYPAARLIAFRAADDATDL